MAILLSILALLFTIFLLTHGQKSKSSRNETQGEWHERACCPNSTFASGFQLKYDPFIGWSAFRDDTTVNAIYLYCSKPGTGPSSKGKNKIFSGEGPNGKPQKIFNCHKDAFIVGFSTFYRAPEPKDATGVSNLRVMCSDGQELVGDGLMEGGEWYAAKPPECKGDRLVCAIESQIQEQHVRVFAIF